LEVVQLLCIDVGSNTQDILLLDTRQTIENAVQLVLPAPTLRIARKIENATIRGEPVVLVGETMGGGACMGALLKHLEAGFEAFATPDAARSFNDNLEKVASWGVSLVSHDEAAALGRGTVIRMGDIDLDVLERSLSFWDITLKPDAIGVAVLDHGAAPPEESQRIFRFRQLEKMLHDNSTLESFIFTSAEIPATLTRMLSVVKCLNRDIPLVLMDTGAAAVLGASLDRVVAAHDNRLAVNVGNSHTIAFLLENRRVMGFFEHHTGALSLESLETLLGKLTDGSLVLEDVWKEGGHGSFTVEKGAAPFLVATGPQRKLLASSGMKPYFAAPFGSMMLVGCFGLVLGIAVKFADWRNEIEKALLFD
jgi:uncharacterized protein (DUF1786 family)